MEDVKVQERDFNLVAKILLGTSMITTGMGIFNCLLKFGYAEYITINTTSLIIEIVLDILIIIAGFATFFKNKWGLIALSSLFVIRMFATIPLDSNMYSYQLGGNMVHLFRDFGLFAIAMCFKKNGISGWKSIFASDEYLEAIIEESHEDSEFLLVNEDKQGVVEEDENPIVEANSEDCIIEEDPQIEKERIQECPSNEETSSTCIHSPKTIVKNRKPTKLWLWGTIVIALLVGIASLYLYVNSQEYPKYITRFGDKFKYCLSIPNNKLAKECVENSRKALDEEFIELCKEYIATANEVNSNKSTIMLDIAEIYFSLAKKSSDKSYYEESKRIINEVLKESPQDIKALEALAIIYHNLGDMERNHKIIEQILFNNPNNEVGLFFMCTKYYNKEDWNSLMKWSKRGYELKDKKGYYPIGCIYYYAKALYETGDKFEAMRIYAEAENKDSFHQLHAMFQEIGGIPCTFISAKIQNKRNNGEVINNAGESIKATNACYLSPVLNIKTNRNGTFGFSVRLLKSKKVYADSYDRMWDIFELKWDNIYEQYNTVELHGEEKSLITLGERSFGNDMPGFFEKGTYRFEIYWESEMLYTKDFNVH